MKRKRKVWWIAGGVAAAFALFVLTVFLIDYNSTDAKIERAVAQIVEEHGFELQDQPPFRFWPLATWEGSTTIVKRGSVSTETAGKIVRDISEACPSWKYEHLVWDDSHEFVATSAKEPWQERHDFVPPKTHSGNISAIMFFPAEKDHLPYGELTARLTIYKHDRLGLWERIKGLWPW